MKNNIKKILTCITLIFLLLVITSCSIFDRSKTNIVNEIRNEYVEYSQLISVLDIEAALVKGSEIAKKCSIGVKIQSSGFFATEASGSAVILKRVANDNNTYTYYAITNRHVTGTKQDTERSVYLGVDSNTGKGIYVKSELVSYDSKYDLALLKFTTGFLLGVAIINSETPNVGSFAIAVGSPYDLEGFFNTVTIGSISAINRIYKDEDTNGQEVLNNFIQHDASINSGNSGGGLFDIYGRLIGINTWKLAGSLGDEYVGLNFAIPVAEVVDRFNNYL